MQLLDLFFFGCKLNEIGPFSILSGMKDKNIEKVMEKLEVEIVYNPYFVTIRVSRF